MTQKSEKNGVLFNNGLRSTKQRHAIMEYLTSVDIPMSAEEIYLHLIKSNINASLSTVYRNLEAMISKKLVTKTTLIEGQCAKFSIAHEGHHHHLICLGCTKIINIDECPLKELENSLNKSTDFEVTGHKLEIYGYCPKCKKI